MSAQLIICIVIFVLTLVSFILNKIPMWVTSMISLGALYITGCLTTSQALAGFANSNTILMVGMFLIANGFQKTTFVDTLCDKVIKLARGSFTGAYAMYIVLTALLTSFISSPVACYTVVVPLIGALCDRMHVSRSKVMFPTMVTVVATCGALPFATAIQQAAQDNGFLATYGFTVTMSPMNYFIGKLPVLILVPLWAIFLGPKMCPAEPVVPITGASSSAQKKASTLTPFQNKAAIVIFFGSMVFLILSSVLGIESWFIAFVGGLLMVITGALDHRTAMKDIPWDMILLYVGALGLGNALTATGAGDVIGNLFAAAVGGSTNNYVLGALFFIIPFIITQFMLNRAVVAVFTPICLLTCQALGANPIGLLVLVQCASLTAFLTPMATPAVPVCMNQGGYDLKTLWKSGWLITIVLAVVYVFYVMTVYPAF